MSPSEMVQTNENLLAQFMSGLDNVSETTKNDYHAKLRNLMKHVQFDADENDIESYLNTVPNPNTRSNKANALIRLRKSCLLYTSDAADDWLVVLLWVGGGAC